MNKLRASERKRERKVILKLEWCFFNWNWLKFCVFFCWFFAIYVHWKQASFIKVDFIYLFIIYLRLTLIIESTLNNGKATNSLQTTTFQTKMCAAQRTSQLKLIIPFDLFNSSDAHESRQWTKWQIVYWIFAIIFYLLANRKSVQLWRIVILMKKMREKLISNDYYDSGLEY